MHEKFGIGGVFLFCWISLGLCEIVTCDWVEVGD